MWEVLAKHHAQLGRLRRAWLNDTRKKTRTAIFMRPCVAGSSG